MNLKTKIVTALLGICATALAVEYFILVVFLHYPSSAFTFNTVALAALPLLVASAFGGIYAVHISRRIQHFTATIEDISRGKLDAHVRGKERQDELGELARAFDRVLVSLKLAVEKVGLKKEELKLGEALEAKERAEREKREAEERYRTLAQSSPDCITLLDAHGKITFMNEAGRAEHNLPQHDERRPFITTVLREPYHARAKRALASALRGKTTTIEVQHKTKADHEWSLETFTPVKDENGKVSAILCVGRDITALKSTEHALTAERSFISRLIENAGVPILAFATDGKLLMSNPTLTKFSGYEKNDLAHQNTWIARAFTSPEAKTKIELAIQSVLSGKTITDFVLPLTLKDGAATLVALNITPLTGEDGQIRGTIHFLRDLSEIFTLERQVFDWVNPPEEPAPRNIQISPQAINSTARTIRAKR
ncbi:PAS domain S-box protein [Candidatus Woesearchaeota archaeon]|nr:MAG: PAS domain S-box protein [Candidatus Woesearchaeota archaeon]